MTPLTIHHVRLRIAAFVAGCAGVGAWLFWLTEWVSLPKDTPVEIGVFSALGSAIFLGASIISAAYAVSAPPKDDEDKPNG